MAFLQFILNSVWDYKDESVRLLEIFIVFGPVVVVK